MAAAGRLGTPTRFQDITGRNGRRVSFIPYPTPLRDADGDLVGAINMPVDISERKSAKNAQKILIDELNHRVKNMLATVQSLANQTARHAADLQEFLQRSLGGCLRLPAHDLLTRCETCRRHLSNSWSTISSLRFQADGW
ncbi:HWE histidine kinase domain-containing protein [Bradyrhizobium sp. 141]|uniref:HWE histidine kinase domain-containing protein n=1 Tax=Bradyrhizobium sp. 141 TaxID=2782617 RepID=UPI001FFAA40C|nr:HWE histidine kinase domain-containing protein [Bradyrhizobium sp. 141]